MKFRFIWLLIFSICVSSLCIYFNKFGLKWISFTALFLWPSWLIGVWIAILYRKRKILRLKIPILSLAFALTLFIALCSRLQQWETWLQYVAWTGFYFFLFVLCLRCENNIKNIKSNWIIKSLTWLGQISFSLYLVHFPLFKLFGYLHRDVFGEKPANFLISLLYLLPVVLFAWIFFKFIEAPIHQWSKK